VTPLRDTVLRRLDPAERYGLRFTLFAIAFLLVAVPFGLLLEQVVNNGSLTRIDTSAANNLHDAVRESELTVAALRVVTFLGGTIWLTAVVAVAASFLMRRGRTRLVVYLVTTTAAGAVLNYAVKLLVSRPRPSLVDPVATASGKSFPSGHAMASTVVYGAILLVFLPAIARRGRAAVIGVAVVLVAAIGFTRLALGVHYITDVLGGFVLGLAWLAATAAAFSIWRVERGAPRVHVQEGLEPEAARDLTP
jgi:membrane-associated phospholipid phosphatase